MITERKLAKELLSAVWNEDAKRVEELIRFGADPSWIFNGYPILVHAVFTRNLDVVNTLIDAGACQVDEALGFALDRGIGEMVAPLAYRGVVPVLHDPKPGYGLYPSRFIAYHA